MIHRLLILEDDDTLRRSFARLFRRRGLDVVVSATIAEAKQVILAEDVDQVLSDVTLSPGWGTEFHEWLGGVDPVLAGRMVFMTGGVSVSAIQARLDALPNPVMQKPFEIPQALSALGLV